MTENVYVIKVKTKPPLSSLYPSERRYSASTVGGLSLVHFGLGALSLLLGTLALSLQGPILSVACLVPFVTGLLAWRRWYIDRNIAIFFYGSLFSMLAASLCFVVTIFDVAAASASPGTAIWPLEKILVTSHPRYLSRPPEDPTNDTLANDRTSTTDNPFNDNDNHDAPKPRESDKLLGLLEQPNGEVNESAFTNAARNDSGLRAEASFIFEERTMTSGEIDVTTNMTQRSSMREKVETFWRNRYHQDSSHTRVLLTLNVLVASLLEMFWSLLSARIAYRGMTRRLPESNGNVAGSKTARLPKRKPPAPKPDILEHDRRLSDSLQTISRLQALTGPGPRLPLPESSREFRERVERFLANQATHRTVEGVQN